MSPNEIFVTATELSILRGLANGSKIRDLANSLDRSESTIEGYITGLLLKFRARTRAQLVLEALRKGILLEQDIESTWSG